MRLSEIVDGWIEVCKSLSDTTSHKKGFYADNETTTSILADYRICVKDAALGNERAQRYLAAFIALRMTK